MQQAAIVNNLGKYLYKKENIPKNAENPERKEEADFFESGMQPLLWNINSAETLSGWDLGHWFRARSLEQGQVITPATYEGGSCEAC